MTRYARLAAAAAVAVAATATSVRAHELRPAYLELREREGDRVDVLWKVPARGAYRLGLSVQLPESCTGEPSGGLAVGSAFVERWRAACPGGLAGRVVSIEGLRATRTDVLARIEWRDGTSQTARLTPESPSFRVASAPRRVELARAYLALGVEHILLGADHLLFVLALLLLVKGWRRLLATVTAFTLGHSVTLAAATLGLVRVAQAPVEAVIALSVAFVAAEILRGAQGRAGLAARAPWALACAFGLLHGLGFAGALREVGLPERDVPLALLLFNAGVELGQLVFVTAAIGVLALVARLVPRRGDAAPDVWHAEARLRTPLAYAVGSLGAFWVAERVASF